MHLSAIAVVAADAMAAAGDAVVDGAAGAVAAAGDAAVVAVGDGAAAAVYTTDTPQQRSLTYAGSDYTRKDAACTTSILHLTEEPARLSTNSEEPGWSCFVAGRHS